MTQLAEELQTKVSHIIKKIESECRDQDVAARLVDRYKEASAFCVALPYFTDESVRDSHIEYINAICNDFDNMEMSAS